MQQNLPQSVVLGKTKVLEGNNNITIRELQDTEVPSVVNAFSDYLEEIENIQEQELTFCQTNVSLFRALVRESMEVYGIHPLVAVIGDKKIGFNFWIKMSGFEIKEEIAHALGTYVRPEFRNLGIAKKLSLASFEYLKEKGIQKVYGKVFKERVSSDKYTNDLGFDKQTILCKTL
jgi:L-amino acid N-acyltransferase YncA